MRYLTKICDQVVALLCSDHSASLVWDNEYGDSEIGSADTYVRESERLFTFEVAETVEQEDSAVSRPGFQMKSSIIVPYEAPHYCSIDPSLFGPRLLPGETVQGLLTVVRIPPQVSTETLEEHPYSKEALSQLLKSNALVLSEDLDEDAVQTLVGAALRDLFPKQCKDWHVRKQHINEIFLQERREKNIAVARGLADAEDSLQLALREQVVDHVISIFPSLGRGGLSSSEKGSMRPLMRPADIRTQYPTIENIIERHLDGAIFDYVPTMSSDFKVLKFGMIALWQLLGENKHFRREARSALFKAFVVEHDFKKALEQLPAGSNFPTRWISSFWSDLRNGEFKDESFKKEMRKTVALVSDSQFLQQLESTDDEDFRSVLPIAKALAQAELSSSIDVVAKKMTHAAMANQQDTYGRDMQLQVENEEREVLNIAIVEFIREINKTSVGGQHSTLYLDRIGIGEERDQAIVCTVTGRLEVLQMPQTSKIKLWIHAMDLTSDDKHKIEANYKHIPTPFINDRLSSSFLLSTSEQLVFYQLLENEILLLVLADCDIFRVYLKRLPVLDLDIQRGWPIKTLNRHMLGQGVLFAFNESKRTLVVCASTKLQLYMFVFDESFSTLQRQGTTIDIAPWYSQGEISILGMKFVCGSEEVALVGSNAQVRIFSLVTLQFRPASLQLHTPPSAIHSAPDGSCLIVLHTHDSGPSLTAYHLETLGPTEGIAIDVPDFPLEGAVLTSIVNRGRIFLIGLDLNAQAVKSVAIDITKKVTEFAIKEKGKKLYRNTGPTQQNSLLDCHSEVWSRFPVLPAVKRRSLRFSNQLQKTLTFITDDHTRPFATYFSDLVQAYQKRTKKPIGNELYDIEVSAAPFQLFLNNVLSGLDWRVSRHSVGEWLVDFLCLIPIRIAVCRENRFVPLANGVLPADHERSLLGAEVNEIVDQLSFGWYEPVFQSYSDLKPIKVVSSIGQQSESYMLNHLVDTSFSGSVTRTRAEGVWMSVTPTDEALIVALDFEGVGSVKRTPQEDTLLVLFCTAISNLVLFRNNFAFNRDIGELFRSFQSSSSILDPTANPTLFHSTLVMVIEDVLEPDTIEITREFSLMFQHIVRQERGANFVSRLHRGKLDIIPFPVIESPEFYKLLSTLKKRLDFQSISHPTAGGFLNTMKALMAKLMVNDWRALSHILAENRAKSLSALLPIALATGYSEIEPDLKPLKNFDSGVTLLCDDIEQDTEARFAISGHGLPLSEDIGMHLAALRESWNPVRPRQEIVELVRRKTKKGRKRRLDVAPQQLTRDSEWVGELASHLSKLIDLRVNHVQLWLDSNLRRFQSDHASIEDLRRRFDGLVIEMRANVQLCRAQCASCNLLCVRSRLHYGDHGCETSHNCTYPCEFCVSSTKSCGLAADHPGNHVCVVRARLCGDPCKLLGKLGCLKGCTKIIRHVGNEHMCSSPVHMCGEPCALKNIQLPGGETFSCQGSCIVPSDQEHDSHSCDTGLCPVTCELCEQQCHQPHLHGLTPGANHLCGNAHSCLGQCAALGICQIHISPQSIESTSRVTTGLQYTRYAQVAKRMQCVRTIPPGSMTHEGEHIHSQEEKPFHFCEARCNDCGNFCTLPLGHAQLEHETSHGAMTRTRWAVNDLHDASLELGGHTYYSIGAPVMCNLVCSSIRRHVHIDYCRTGGIWPCGSSEVQHITDRIAPEPDKPKDVVTHNLYWKRMGFKDPYTCDEQAFFGKCDAMCLGPEHVATENGPGKPSYCTLSMFHPPQTATIPEDGDGYLSNDGHKFLCRNPVLNS